MITAEIKPLVGKNCTLKYGDTGLVVGPIVGVDKDYVRIKGKYGEYSIPLDQVKSVVPG